MAAEVLASNISMGIKQSIKLVLLLTLYTSYSQKLELNSYDLIQLSNQEKGFSYMSLYDFSGDNTMDIVSILDTIDLISYQNGHIDHDSFLFQENLESSGAIATDVNADGMMDLMVGSYWSNRFSVYEGTRENGFSAPIHYTLDGHCNGVAVGFIDDDGYPDVVAIRNGSGRPIAIHVFLNNQDGTFERSYFHDSGGDTNSELQITDLNNDGKNDILIRSSNGFVLSYLQNEPDDFTFHFVPIMPVIPGTLITFPGGTGMANEDFDNDGYDDLLITYFDSLIIRKGTGDGSFETPGFFKSTQITLSNIVAIDLDKDDTLDIAGIEYNTSSFSFTDSLLIFKYDPMENLMLPSQEIRLPTKPLNFNSTQADDFTGDGVIDFAVHGEENKLAFLKMRPLNGPPLSIPDTKLQEVIIYPNPTVGTVLLETNSFLGESLEIKIYTLSGEMISSYQFPHVSEPSLEIEIEGIEQVLILQVIVDDTVYTKRVIIRE